MDDNDFMNAILLFMLHDPVSTQVGVDGVRPIVVLSSFKNFGRD